MEKIHLAQNHDESNNYVKRKANEEELEISSTGYGLESVSKDTEETKNRNQSCGGL
ncbi:hypothetical protein ACQKP0_20265 [Heyndrickxia sp. NPDC080065]|uniref:hypothetical protein n=1 Tax=Heyndrickxia sp. NPDC080065 TaxID=3390568 RepID=UPI003D0747C9